MKTCRIYRFGLCAVGSAAVVLGQTGCATPQLDAPDVSRMMANATGEPLIEFRTSGGTVDDSDVFSGDLLLGDAVARALRSSPEVQTALARAAVARAEAEQSRLFPNPIVSVGLRFPQGSGKPIIDVGLAADLIALLQRPGRISAGDNRLRASSAEAVSAALDVVSKVQDRYAAVQAFDALVPILEERRRINSRLLNLAQARLQAGETSRLDVTIAQAQQVDLEVEISDRLLERRNARLELARLIGRPSGKIDWTLAAFQPPQSRTTPETDWIAAAMRSRPEIQVRNFELAALGADVKLTKLSVFEASGVGVDSERDGDWSVGPAFNGPIPIFDWGQARRDAAKARVIEARHELIRVGREIIQDVRTAYGVYESSLASLVRVRDELIPLEQQRRDQAEAAYKAGQTDITTLVLAEQDLQAARARLIELQQRAAAASIGLERAVGGRVAAASIAPNATAGRAVNVGSKVPVATSNPTTRDFNK